MSSFTPVNASQNLLAVPVSSSRKRSSPTPSGDEYGSDADSVELSSTKADKKKKQKPLPEQDRSRSLLKGVSAEDFWAGVDQATTINQSRHNEKNYKNAQPFQLPSGKQVKVSTLITWKSRVFHPERHAQTHKESSQRRLDLLYRLLGSKNKNHLTQENARIKELGYKDAKQYLEARRAATTILNSKWAASKSKLGKFYQGLNDWNALSSEGRLTTWQKLGIKAGGVKLPRGLGIKPKA